jgi:S-adenosylmethionine:tRNA ribosyltransferase-isomerase
MASPPLPDADFRLASYDFELPPESVAQQPLAERDASRLLTLDRQRGALAHRRFRELPDLLRPGDLLVLNRSRVFPARLLGRRPGGGAAELLLVRRVEANLWEALARPGRRLGTGALVEVAPGFAARIEGAGDGPTRLVRLLADGGADAAIERHGHVPLPPYIRRPDVAADRERYQTVFSREAGSVAAPTAGLHFTPELLARLAAHGVLTTTLVLHVGPGTFRPVEADDVRQHRVEAERFSIPAEAAAAFNRARADGRRVIAVGTTATRTLESALAPDGTLQPGEGETALVIVPGHRFRAIDALVTNFHLPRSSLLLLVSAFAGRTRVLSAYAEAVRAGYRFYSYGDAMLIA